MRGLQPPSPLSTTYAYNHVQTNKYKHTCTNRYKHACTNMYKHACVHTCNHVQTNKYKHVQICMYEHVQTCVYMQTCTNMRVYTSMYKHASANMHGQTCTNMHVKTCTNIYIHVCNHVQICIPCKGSIACTVYLQYSKYNMYILVKAPLRVLCNKIQHEGWGRVENAAQGKAECCISHDTPPQVLYFIIHHEYTCNALQVCWFCMGGLITLCIDHEV